MKITKLSLLVLSLLVIAALGTAVGSFAQERQMGGVGLTVFTDKNFRDKSSTFRQSIFALRSELLIKENK